MSDVITPLMSMRLPTPGVTKALGVAPPGEDWLSLLNSALSSLDAHNHSPGKGMPVPTSGIGINADLPFAGYNATAVRSVRMSDQASPLTAPADIGCVYRSGGELYFRDASGNNVQITSGGALNAASIGAIGGDYATSGASLAYGSVAKLFSFESSAGVKAGIAAGPLQLFDPLPAGKKVTIAAPSGLAADYQITMPGSLPGATKILTLSSAGAISAVYDVDGSTLEVSSNALRVKGLGIGTSQLADLAVSTQKIANGAVTAVKTDAVSTGTASKLVVRDAAGRAQFADPSADADADTRGARAAAIVAAIGDTADPVSSPLAALGGTPVVARAVSRAGFVYGAYTLTGSIADAGDAFLTSGSALFTLPVGYRPTADIVLPVVVFLLYGAPNAQTQPAYIKITTAGVARLHRPTLAGGETALDTGDILYFSSAPSWVVS